MARKEEAEEFGGYFIVNGIEKYIRFLLLNKRNFPLAINRASFKNRGPGYTSYAVSVRSVRPDETSQTNTLHYLEDGNLMVRFSWRKQEYLVPVMLILSALGKDNDAAVWEGVAGPAGPDGFKATFLTDHLELLLRLYKTYKQQHNVYSSSAARAHLGERFRPVLAVPEHMSHLDVGTEFLRRVILVHLGNVDVSRDQDLAKANFLMLMMRKLYALVDGDCTVDNVDALQHQEILLGGFLYGMILKERLEELLRSLRPIFATYFRGKPRVKFTSDEFRRDFPREIFKRANENIGNLLEYFLATGNLSSPSGLDLQQASGLTMVAEKLNFPRFISHFRSVHRGAFFAQLKTTAVRKLLPESWGFMCPVHTPDGAPCGLLNHLAHKCMIVTEPVDTSQIPLALSELGVGSFSTPETDKYVPVLLDGLVFGYCSPRNAKRISDVLRYWKVEGSRGIPLETEIGYVPNSNGGSYPGIYISTLPSRMLRPVKYLPLDKLDLVGPHEQPYMSIACIPEEIEPVHTHVEFTPTHILSILANMTPFSDHNQSPRNMYQCQMAKQTMGTPGTALRFRTDNKIYRLQTGQTPIVRAPLHNEYGFDNYPNGTNAVVAVISYTGYDMDDAMIINKSAHERGFAHGTIFKTKTISLKESGTRSRTVRGVTRLFGFAPGGPVKSSFRALLDDDGLPRVGQLVRHGDPLAAWHTVQLDYGDKLVNRDGRTQYEKYHDDEDAFIEEVLLVGNDSGTEPLQTIIVKLRIPRAPVIGDKFSSRHGQKGVLSQKYPAIDMPFTESGIQPDIIINPHAFPSRMTIGMFIESLAGKAGALHGLAQDSTPFTFGEDDPAGDYFGHQLMKAGFNYHGNEPMYSGITGEEFQADIFIGVVYYQRLRHMVNDKYQVRTTGPIVPTTGQPVGGRKRGGGVRFGEMERDAIMAHGAAFLLQDRLLNCSDYTRTWICRSCGSFLPVQPIVPQVVLKRKGYHTFRCRKCATPLDQVDKLKDNVVQGDIWSDGQGRQYVGGDNTTQVVVPGALKYLDAELSGMGIKLKFAVSPEDMPRKGKLKRTAVDDKPLVEANGTSAAPRN